MYKKQYIKDMVRKIYINFNQFPNSNVGREYRYPMLRADAFSSFEILL